MRTADTMALPVGVPATASLPIFPEPVPVPRGTRRRHRGRRPTRYRLPFVVELVGMVALFVGGLGVALMASEVASSVPERSPVVTVKIAPRDPAQAVTKTPKRITKPAPSPAPKVEPRR